MRFTLWIYPNRDGNEAKHAAALLRAAADEVERAGADASREIETGDAGIAHLKFDWL